MRAQRALKRGMQAEYWQLLHQMLQLIDDDDDNDDDDDDNDDDHKDNKCEKGKRKELID